MITPALAAIDTPITTPSVAYHALLPIFIVLGAAILGVVVEAVVPRPERFAASSSSPSPASSARWSRSGCCTTPG